MTDQPPQHPLLRPYIPFSFNPMVRVCREFLNIADLDSPIIFRINAAKRIWFTFPHPYSDEFIWPNTVRRLRTTRIFGLKAIISCMQDSINIGMVDEDVSNFDLLEWHVDNLRQGCVRHYFSLWHLRVRYNLPLSFTDVLANNGTNGLFASFQGFFTEIRLLALCWTADNKPIYRHINTELRPLAQAHLWDRCVIFLAARFFRILTKHVTIICLGHVIKNSDDIRHLPDTKGFLVFQAVNRSSFHLKTTYFRAWYIVVNTVIDVSHARTSNARRC